MIRIGICEDDKKQAKQIKEITERSLFKRTEYMTTLFSSGEEVIQAIEANNFNVDLLLLDIHMNSMDGLQTAEYLRKNRIDVDVIFITISEKYIYEGYTYKAFSYILKSMLAKRLETELKRYMDEKETISESLSININGTIEMIPLDKVYYFESNARKVTAHINSGDIEFYNKLDTLENMLADKGYMRCHQSYLINTRYLSSVSRESVTVNGNKIPLSRKYYEIMKRNGVFNEQGDCL